LPIYPIGQGESMRKPTKPTIRGLARRLARKKKMMDEYERVAGECDKIAEKKLRAYMLKRAGDFRAEVKQIETEIAVKRHCGG
jgi:hypothetical protein